MDKQEMKILHEKIDKGVKIAVAKALDRHRRLGESIAIWRDGEVVILPPEEIPVVDIEVLEALTPPAPLAQDLARGEDSGA